MKPLFFALYIFFVFNCSLFSQVKVLTRDGFLQYGFEVEQTDKQILKLTDEDDLEFYIPRSEIKSIQNINCTIICKNVKYEGHIYKLKDSIYYLNTKIDKENIELNKREISSIEILRKPTSTAYSSFGITLIGPGGLNVVFGYMFSSGGFRIEGGTFNSVYGFQGNFLINLNKSESFESNISLGFGYTSIETDENIYDYGYNYNRKVTKDWTYGGIFYDFNFHGVFFEGGLSFGTGSFSSPQLNVQIGYIFRFND
ncbi:MAG: hypothetical protein ABSG15_04605 [FCB group bacterium]|jgi:hypothetical protein